ncbi:C-terminal binding protein [Meredithblackwellia eburnea MCA 4105]
MTAKKVLTIIELEGMHLDDVVEKKIFASAPFHDYEIEFVRVNLGGINGTGEMKPLTLIPKDLAERTNGIMVLRHYMAKAEIDLFPNLKVVVRCGVGYDRLDRKYLAEKGVTVCNVPDYGTEEIADHSTALHLSLRRGIVVHHERQRAASPAGWAVVESPLVSRLRGATFGVIGLGRIGTATALRAKAFGMHVIFYDPYLPNGVDKSLGFERVRKLEDIFTRSNTISVHCPLTSETRGLVSTELLALVNPGTILVNTARGEIVSLSGVEAAMKQGNLAGAGLDVLEVEPIPEPPHPLLAAYRAKEQWLEGRLLITPHSAFYSPSSYADIRTNSAQTMKDVLIDGLQSNVISPLSE